MGTDTVEPLPVTRDDLQRLRCNDPLCTEKHPNARINLSPRCHPSAPVRVVFIHDRGVLEVSCAICGFACPAILVGNAKELIR